MTRPRLNCASIIAVEQSLFGNSEIYRLQSRLLRGNPLGDPMDRDCHVYLPPGYHESSRLRVPALLALTGFTGAGAMLFL